MDTIMISESSPLFLSQMVILILMYSVNCIIHLALLCDIQYHSDQRHYHLLLRPQHSSKEFIKHKEESVRRHLMYQPRHATPQECHGTALVPNCLGTRRYRPAVRCSVPRSRLQSRLNDIEWICQVTSNATSRRTRDHIICPSIIVGALP